MLAVVDTHPIQYHAPVYRALQTLGVPVTVVYGSDAGVRGYHDVEFGTRIEWDVDLLSGYRHRILIGPSAAPQSGPAVTTRGLGAALRDVAPDAVLLNGYGSAFHRAAWRAAWRLGRPILFRGETTDGAVERGGLKASVRRAALRSV
jgi:hypothetical protein